MRDIVANVSTISTMIITHSKTALLLFLFLYPSVSFCQDSNPILEIGQKITLHSAVLKETREVWIYLPPNYSDEHFEPQHFPVLFVLDGNLHFHSLSGLIQILGAGINQTYTIPEMIVVAIPNTNRVRDLIPTHSRIGVDGKEYDFYEQSGGTDTFLQFLTNELAPKIDSTYRTTPYRILIGQSFGGIAVIHALLKTPAFFNAYVSIDPSLWWDNGVLVKQAREHFGKTDMRGKCLFLAQANFLPSWSKTISPFEAIKEFAGVLETYSSSGLKWKYKFYPDDDHSSVALVGEYDALRFIFEKYRMNYNNTSTADQLKLQYQQLSKDLDFTFLPPERVTQTFGSIYQSLSQYDNAHAFFQMNLENYPNSSSAYADMGQYWKTKVDKKKALQYYERSVKIFPDNKDSRNNIANLKKQLEDEK